MVRAEQVFGSTPPPCNARGDGNEIMSDLHRVAPPAMSDDALYQQIVLGAAAACRAWAAAEATAQLDLLLYPRDRGPVAGQRPYLVTQKVVERGVWRVTLCPEDMLPAGVPVSTRDSVVKAQIARSATVMSFPALDHVIQAGLFGEVLYP